MSESGSYRSAIKLPHGVQIGRPALVRTGVRPTKSSKTVIKGKTLGRSGSASVGPNIAVLNASTVLTDTDVQTALTALQKQLDNDFAPVWGITADLRFIKDRSEMATYDWLITVADDSDQADVLGFHDITNMGQPVGFVFAKTDLQCNLSWTVTLSHEVLEMLMDPYTTNVVFNQTSNTGGTLYAFEMCLHGDTKIPLLNGQKKKIKNLVGQEFWVYSCTKDGQIKPGYAHSVRKTRQNAQLVKVMLDNGRSIKCTPDHRFMLRDGSYCEAQHLTVGQSLMPLYRRKRQLETHNAEYEQVYNPATRKYEFTHRLIAPNCPHGCVRHHADFNRFNNEPTNIEIMAWDVHQQLHQTHVAQLTKPWRDAAIALGVHPFQQPQSREQRQQSSERITAYNKSPEHRELARELGRDNMAKYIWGNPEVVAKMVENSSERMTELNKTPEHRAMLAAVLRSKKFRRAQSKRTKLFNHNRWHVNRGMTNPDCQLCLPNNHKVVAVKWLKEIADVYDFTVAKYHNFATAAGVFVHNCDPCESDAWGYAIDGILLSDFVYPAWFEAFRTGPKFDHSSKLTQPFSIGEDGYVSIFRIPNKHGWTQLFNRNIGQRLRLKLQRGKDTSRTLRRASGGVNQLDLPHEQLCHTMAADELEMLPAEE